MDNINKIFTTPFLIADSKNISYITGANFEGFWLICYQKNFLIITSEMIKGQIKQFFKNRAKIFTIKTSFSDTLVEICKEYKIKELTVDITNISYQLFNLLHKKLKQNKISIVADNLTISKQRIIKNKNEIKNIKKACEIVSKVFETVKKSVVAGMSELDIHFKIEEEFAKQKVVQSFKTIVASGPNAANPHHISSSRKIKANDVILIDMGCIYKGYCSDLTRTFFVGKKVKEQQKVWNIVKLAHDEALKNVKENINASYIDLCARNIIKQAGYEKQFIHTTGHGVGLDIHEAPSISTKSTEILKEGMIITIEPGIYLENKFGIRIEDTVLVTKNGYKVLTTANY